MGRLGTFDGEEVVRLARAVAADPDLELAGVWTHFATADEPDDDEGYFFEQLARFEPVAEAVHAEHPGVTVHAANSAAVFRSERSHFDMARCGVAIYGLDPFQLDPTVHGLAPVLSLRSHVAAVKRFPAGQSAGYGRRWRAPEDTWVGVVPLGYGDGVRRALTNDCDVLVDGRRYPLVGTVSMDNLTIDLGPETAVEPGAEAVLIGRQGEEEIRAEELAARLGTINYEVTSGDPAPRPEARRVSLADDLRAAPLPAAAIRALGGGEGVWIAGGAVRDAALGRDVTDLDLAVAGDPGQVAKALARELGEHAFELSAEFRTWRVVAPGRGWQVDVTALRGDSIEADLAARDFTVGAVAVPLAGGEAIDPTAASPTSSAASCARSARGASRRTRCASCAPRASPPASTSGSTPTPSPSPRRAPRAPPSPPASASSPSCASSSAAPTPLRGLELLDELRITAVVLPELEGTKGVEQGPNHHLDVHGHTLEVLAHTLEIEADLARFVGEERAAEAAAFLAEPLADEMDRATALRLGALLHDIAKPQTRQEKDGFVGFKGHDVEGVDVIGAIMGRLRASRKLTRYLQALTLHHLRLGFMIREAPLPPRRVHDYLRATEPVTVDVTLLTVADRLSARGAGPIAAPEMVQAHLDLAREMVAAGARLAPRRAAASRSCGATRSPPSSASRAPRSVRSWPSWRPPSTPARSPTATGTRPAARLRYALRPHG